MVSQGGTEGDRAWQAFEDGGNAGWSTCRAGNQVAQDGPLPKQHGETLRIAMPSICKVEHRYQSYPEHEMEEKESKVEAVEGENMKEDEEAENSPRLHASLARKQGRQASPGDEAEISPRLRVSLAHKRDPQAMREDPASFPSRYSVQLNISPSNAI